jgi:lipopolysaccharide transport system ATP-binding protein
VDLALMFDSISKDYRGVSGYRALRDDMAALAGRLLGRAALDRRPVKALDAVSFEIPEGQSVALIGENGAGKTTALKIATRITYPTAGRMRLRGRVGALIEVGTGMHPELTGRENIHLYGRIMGLSRRDVSARFDQITEFSGIGAAVDQQVKQYSSGMTLRLGFSVAAHLEPDVFIVDEAIAVGDAAFQYRCIERMTELVKQGRTLIFVSHDLFTVEALCQRAIWLDHGRIRADGLAPDVISRYLEQVHRDRVGGGNGALAPVGGATGLGVDIDGVALLDGEGRPIDEALADQPLTIRLYYHAEQPVTEPTVRIGLSAGGDRCFTLAAKVLTDSALPSGAGWLDCAFPALPLQPRSYELWGEIVAQDGMRYLVAWQRLRNFMVGGDLVDPGRTKVAHSLIVAPVRLPYEWRMGPAQGGLSPPVANGQISER